MCLNPDQENGRPVWSMDQLVLQHFSHVLHVYGLGQMQEKLVSQVWLHHKVACVSTAASLVPCSCGLPRMVLILTLISWRLTATLNSCATVGAIQCNTKNGVTVKTEWKTRLYTKMRLGIADGNNECCRVYFCFPCVTGQTKKVPS